MIRRSTLVFLTCLAAVGIPAMRTKSAASAVSFSQPFLDSSESHSRQHPSVSQPLLIAQASGGISAGNLDINSKGEAVKALQVRLQQAGYYSGAIDGLYGFDTQRAVIAFQADAGLEQTGSLNDETYQKLREQSALLPNSINSGPSSESSPDSSSADASNPVLEPTASELPAVDAEEDTIVAGDSQAGGLGRLFGFGLGIAAMLASFGVGFYVANRDQADKEGEGEWGELETNGGLARSERSLAGGSANGGMQPSNTATQTGRNRQNIGTAASSSGMIAGSISPVSQSLSTNNQMGAQMGGQMGGQIGETAPMAQMDVIDGLIGDLRNPDPARRRKAIWELGQRGNSLAMQPLVNSMVDADSKEKSLVLAALSEIGIRSLKPMSRALAIALQDDNPEVRKNAIRDLTRVYELVVQISQMLSHATEDEDSEVRQTATWALEQLNRIRRGHDEDPAMRAFSGGSGGGGIGGGSGSPPIDLLASEASLRRSQQGF